MPGSALALHLDLSFTHKEFCLYLFFKAKKFMFRFAVTPLRKWNALF